MNVNVFDLVFAEASNYSFLKFSVERLICGKESQVLGQKNSIEALSEDSLAQWWNFAVYL